MPPKKAAKKGAANKGKPSTLPLFLHIFISYNTFTSKFYLSTFLLIIYH